MEQIELDARKGEIVRDVKRLVEKYRAIFDWNVPDIDQKVADGLILNEVTSALEVLKIELLSR